ncbi:hypothetical protein GT043_38340, partial [Streptomyces sp. SID2131]|nr:hypothetical protein [Streptomyces sp. SID2131]
MVAAFLRRSRHRDRPRPQGGGMSTELDSSKVLTLTPVPVVPVPTQTTAPTAPESAEPTPPPMPVTTGALDTRTLSRSLFLRLRALDAEGAAADSPERTYVRDTLIELNLPLVRYAAARFRSRNEPMEDIVQVGTIGLIKAIDRFD